MKHRATAAVTAALLATALFGPGTANADGAVRHRVSASSSYACQFDTFAQSGSGRIRFRRVINAHVQIDKTSSAAFSWHPLSWGIYSSEDWPGREVDQQLVPSSDGRIRYVETDWSQGSPSLRVTVLRSVGSGFPHHLTATDGFAVYWLSRDGILHRSVWHRTKLGTPKALPVKITGATTISVNQSPNGTAIYVTDRTGALHFIHDDGDQVRTYVLSTHGYGAVTSIKPAYCMSPSYVYVRSYLGLLVVKRSTGNARFARHLGPDTFSGGSLTPFTRVRPAGWTERWLG